MLNKYDKYYKEYLKLMSELNDLMSKRRRLPKVKCIPYQDGWVVSIRLREDILNREDADFLVNLIKIGYSEKIYIRDIKEIRLIRKGIYSYTRGKGDRKLIVDLIPPKRRLSEKQYEALTEQQKRHFLRYTDGYNYRWLWTGHKTNYDVYYKLFVPAYWIKLRVKPNMVSEMRDISPELEARYQYVKDQLEKPPYMKYYYRSYSGRENTKKDKNYINE